MQISNRIAGYSLGDADLLRRAMGKKKIEEMAKQRERFIKGALERGFPQKKVEKIFDRWSNLPATVSTSRTRPPTRILPSSPPTSGHYPVDFMARCSRRNREHGEDCQIHQRMPGDGDQDSPPDVNHSEWSFTPDGEAIRFGMGAVKNLSNPPSRRSARRARR